MKVAILLGELASLVSTATTIAYAGTASAWKWETGLETCVQIHTSCNASESIMLQKGLTEVRTLAQISIDHIHAHKYNSSIVQKFFGSGSLAEVVGWYSRLVSGNMDGVLFRCDDIDGNCIFPEWYGHWRGSNATSETVICPRTYSERKGLEQMCFGDALKNISQSAFMATDFIHRLFHIPTVSDGLVDHHADTYEECLELAKTHPEEAVRNTHSLQWFAVEVFSYELVVPGVGCTGDQESVMASATSTKSAAITSASASPNNGCKGHGDHWHCPAGVIEPTYPPRSKRSILPSRLKSRE